MDKKDWIIDCREDNNIMKILVINCHCDNRGDEAAIHAMVDELNKLYTNLSITLAIRGIGTRYPNMPSNVKMIRQFCPGSFKSKIAHNIALITKGTLALSHNERILVNEIKDSDIVVHAPGGPSIGDLYYDDEPSYLSIFDLIISMNKKYMFYAPSMGPFKVEKRNKWRKKILCKATAIVVRDPISYSYVNNFVPEKKPILTLDSALQHDIDLTSNKVKLDKYKELCSFIKKHKKCIGVTITDLSWHPKYSNNEIKIKIKETFTNVLKNFVQNGYGIVFIPQLYGLGNDYNLMKEYCFDEENYFVICSDDEKYDTYFQQYVIGCMYAVIGMRYHSNIFSAKMGTPFISISYEQKMQGFMKKMELDRYCISLDKLSDEELKNKFSILTDNYDEYKKYLISVHEKMKKESYETTNILKDILL